MAEFIVNLVLITAVLVLLTIWAASSARRRRQTRREHAEDRHLILAALMGIAPTAGTAEPLGAVSTDEHEPSTSAVCRSRPSNATAPERPLDAAGLVALLENPHPLRRGTLAGLFTSPRTVWSAGARAGRTVARTLGDSTAPFLGETDGGLCREAAVELVDIHAHDRADARRAYARYAAAVGDTALAELYVRSAAYATYAEHDAVLRVATEITGTSPNWPAEASDDNAGVNA